MVKLESWFLDEIRGSIKGHCFKTFDDKRGVVRVEDPSPSYTRTTKQDEVRNSFKQVKDEWNALTEAEQEGWRVKAGGSGLTGYQYYIKQNINIIFGLEPLIYDFEDGTSQDFVLNVGSVDNGMGFDSSYSIYTSTDIVSTENLATLEPDELVGGKKISKFSYYFRETSNHSGGGFEFYDSNDNVVVGVTTNNPEWCLRSSSGREEIYEGDGYDRWVYVELVFDWGNAEFTYYFEDMASGTSRSGSRSLINSSDVERILWKNTNSFVQDGWGSYTCGAGWVDYVKVEF